MDEAVTVQKVDTNVIIIDGQSIPVDDSNESFRELSERLGLDFIFAMGDRIQNFSKGTVVGTILSPFPKPNTRLLCYKRDCDGKICAASHTATQNIKFLD